MSLPNPSMNFTPFDPLPASDLNDVVENVEALAAGTGLNDAVVTPEKLTNPYKFSVARTSAQTLTANVWTKVQFATEFFDTNNNYDNATNYRYTAPVTGYYYINVEVGIGGAGTSASIGSASAIYKNGVLFRLSGQVGGSGTAATLPRPQVSALMYLTAGQYVEGWAMCGEGSRDVNGNDTFTVFEGYLVSV